MTNQGTDTASARLAALDAGMTKGVIGRGWSPDHSYTMNDLYGAAALRNALPSLVALVAAAESQHAPGKMFREGGFEPGWCTCGSFACSELAALAALNAALARP